MQTPEYIPYQRKRARGWLFLAVPLAGILLALLVYQIPRVQRAVDWRMDIAITYLTHILRPSAMLPPPVVKSHLAGDFQTATPLPPTATTQPSPTPLISPTPTLTPTPIPSQVALTPPAYDEAKDKQDWNNCGPATLALYLRYYGWKGDQFDISRIIKPERDDRNVNVEELVYYVRSYAGWLNAEFRVAGDIDILRKLLAEGVPVMIEKTFTTDRKYWPEDDRWSGHYLLITGFDDQQRLFTAQDSEIGPNQRFDYDMLDGYWQSFNRVYILVYPPEKEAAIQSILGEQWDRAKNREHALKVAQAETEKDQNNAFAWFNLGSNLVYFERYIEAAQAYDQARLIGLPQRMFRYQFGPFMAYFHSGRTEDLMALTKYALEITRVSEEAMLWRGWGFYRLGDKSAALSMFRAALKVRPDYEDALYAIDFVNAN